MPRYLSAAAAAIVVAAAAVVAIGVTVVAAAAEEQDQDDDPPAAVPTKTVVTHNEYLRELFSGITAHSKIFRSVKKVQQFKFQFSVPLANAPNAFAREKAFGANLQGRDKPECAEKQTN